MVDLEAFVDKSIRLSIKARIHPTRFIELRALKGTREAINQLVLTPRITDGFTNAVLKGLKDYTLESAVLKFPQYFSDEVRDAARRRLA